MKAIAWQPRAHIKVSGGLKLNEATSPRSGVVSGNSRLNEGSTRGSKNRMLGDRANAARRAGDQGCLVRHGASVVFMSARARHMKQKRKLGKRLRPRAQPLRRRNGRRSP